jgi:hypothetical protein
LLRPGSKYPDIALRSMLKLALQQNTTRFLPPKRAAKTRLENRMTEMANRLGQKQNLLTLALEHTTDLNEAHLFVHHAMARSMRDSTAGALSVDRGLVGAVRRRRPLAFACAQTLA